MANIKQITDYDLSNTSPITKSIVRAGEMISYPYKKINKNMLVGSDSGYVTKLGYCCEPKGIGYPIFLVFKESIGEIAFEIGKTGMFEFQPEEWIDINDEESIEDTAIVSCTEVLVPADIHFTLDYWCTK